MATRRGTRGDWHTAPRPMMEYLRLLVAVLLPWLAGCLWLAVLEQRFNRQPPNRLRQLGYGLFLGYSGLQGIVLAANAATGGIELWRINSVLVLLSLAAGLLLLRARLAATGTEADATLEAPAIGAESSPGLRYLFWLLVVWAALHLVFVTIEILHRPVFPWDAWLNWMYRAKAWFYAGQVFELDSPRDWLLGTGTGLYNVAGNDYPTFAPVLALWCATALGHWSETLVNTPVLLCGIALGLAVYGQCREHGLQRWLSALAAYLLLSIPLVGTHLALAGQADIWMAGFTGLGFVAILRGCIEENRYQILLGLGMTALGVAVKNEGAVWFLAALLALSLSARPLGTAIVIGVVAVLIAVAWLVGITQLDIPLLGLLGVENGRLHIPMVGIYSLQRFDLWDDYRDNFFRNGTWHLLWTFLSGLAIALFFLSAGTLRRSVAIMLPVVLAAQLLIFVGTEQGQWAEDWSAINRLPLHFSPLLVFSLMIAVQAISQKWQLAIPVRPALVFPAAGLVVVTAATVIFFLISYPGDSGQSRTFTPADLRVVAGTAPLRDKTRRITAYQDSVALLASGPLDMDAAKYGLLRVRTSGPNPNHATFFWRSGRNDPALHTLEISGRGTRWIDLAKSSGWNGAISEIGIIFYGYGGKPVELHGLEFTPYSLASHLQKLFSDWSEITYWSQKSAHWVPAGAETAAVPLPLLMAAWVVITAILTVSIERRKPEVIAGALLCALLAWLVLDLRWTINNAFQTARTLKLYPLVTAEALEFGNDRNTHRLVERARPTIEETYKRTVIAAEDPTMRFQMFRAKYLALPAATWVHGGPIDETPAQLGDYVLVLRNWQRQPGEQPLAAAGYTESLAAKTGLELEPVFDESEGFLLEVDRPYVDDD